MTEADGLKSQVNRALDSSERGLASIREAISHADLMKSQVDLAGQGSVDQMYAIQSSNRLFQVLNDLEDVQSKMIAANTVLQEWVIKL